MLRGKENKLLYYMMYRELATTDRYLQYELRVMLCHFITHLHKW